MPISFKILKFLGIMLLVKFCLGMFATLTPSRNGNIYIDLDTHLLSTFTKLNKLYNVMKCLLPKHVL